MNLAEDLRAVASDIWLEASFLSDRDGSKRAMNGQGVIVERGASRIDELEAKVAALEEEELRLHDVIGELQMQVQFTTEVALEGAR